MDVVHLLKDAAAFLREAQAKFDKLNDLGELHVCLDCRKIYGKHDKFRRSAHRRHAYFCIKEFECDEVGAVLDFIQWVLKQVGGD